MKVPRDVAKIERKGMVLFKALISDLYDAIDLLNRTPKFVDNPVGLRLRDIEENVDTANDFLYNILEIASAIHQGEFIKEEGG